MIFKQNYIVIIELQCYRVNYTVIVTAYLHG